MNFRPKEEGAFGGKRRSHGKSSQGHPRIAGEVDAKKLTKSAPIREGEREELEKNALQKKISPYLGGQIHNGMGGRPRRVGDIGGETASVIWKAGGGSEASWLLSKSRENKVKGY